MKINANCRKRVKAQNAFDNGASGVLIANSNPSGNGAGIFSPGGEFAAIPIPVMMIRFGLGADLKSELDGGLVMAHMVVSDQAIPDHDPHAIPEPSTFVLGLLAVAGVGLFGRRRRRRAT